MALVRPSRQNRPDWHTAWECHCKQPGIVGIALIDAGYRYAAEELSKSGLAKQFMT